jgi:hypothetical protein
MQACTEKDMARHTKQVVDHKRRQILARLGAAVGAVYLAPALARLGPARASDSFSGSGASSDSGSSPSSSYSAPARPRPQQARPRRPSEIIVSTIHPADIDALPGLGFRVLDQQQSLLLGMTMARIALPSGLALGEAIEQLQSHLPDATIAENTYYETSELPCVDGNCAAFDLIGWRPEGTCNAAPVIGMIDTGVNPDYEALAGQALEVVPVPQGGRDAAGRVHGTAIATLLVGRRDSRTPGLLPNARLIATEAFFRDAVGEAADSFSLIRALEALAERDVSVINMSFAGAANPLLDQALDALSARGIALVAAAGNGGPAAPPAHPAAHPSVIAVTAIGRSLAVYRQAASGEHIAFAAPGVQVWTAASISGGRFRSGTSFAAPFVTAALAVAALETPDADPMTLADRLAESAQDLGESGRDRVFGWGLLQVEPFCGL